MNKMLLKKLTSNRVGNVTEEIEVCLGITWLGLRSQKLTQAEGKSCVGPRTNRA